MVELLWKYSLQKRKSIRFLLKLDMETVKYGNSNDRVATSFEVNVYSRKKIACDTFRTHYNRMILDIRPQMKITINAEDMCTYVV